MAKERFSLFIVLSLAAHLALFGLVVILGPEDEKAPSPAIEQAKDFGAFKEALRQAAADGAVPERLANAMLGLSEEELAEAFRQAPVLDSRLTGQEKAGLYKKMANEALANFTEGTGGERSALDEPLSRYFGSLREIPRADPADSFELVKLSDALDESARLFRISKQTARELQTLLAATAGTADHKSSVLIEDEAGHVDSVPGEYFYRDSPYIQFAAVGARLFFVVKGFPELPAATSAEAGRGRTRPSDPVEPAPAFRVVYIPLAHVGDAAPLAPSKRPVLSLGPGDAERILDDLMGLPREEQVRTFYRDYLSKYDPDDASLAHLTEAFIYTNLGMVFIEMDDPLSRGFDLLEEVYYDNLSQDELVPFALENPKTRTGTAILLCLAASYEFERRVIAALDGSLQAAKEVLAAPSSERYFVHNKDVKAYVLREVYQDLAAELRRRSYPSMASVLRRYREEQLKIYDALIRMGGEARSRALYAQGRLYWDEGDVDLALTVWKGIDPALVGGTSKGVRQSLAGQRDRRFTLAVVEEILGREASSDRISLYERIARFHTWEKR